MSFPIKPKLLKSKLQAFSIHLGISLGIFFVLLYFIVFAWYPQPFFSADGGFQGLRLIALVDLVLGPALTFIVFKPGKPGLKFDLSVIAIAQIAALTWGVWAVHNERPIAVVFTDDRFYTLPHRQLTKAGINLKELEKFGARLPVITYIDIPDDPQERYELFSESFNNQTPLFYYGSLYRHIDKRAIEQIAIKSIDMQEHLGLKGRTDEMRNKYNKFLSTTTNPPSDYLYLALYARHGRFIAVVDRETFDFVEVLDIPPPQVFSRTIHVGRELKKKNTANK